MSQAIREFFQLPADVQSVLVRFETDFMVALAGEPMPWAEQLGLSRTSSALLKTLWPIPASTAGYKEFDGDMKYRQLAHKSITLTQKVWQDGWKEVERVLMAPDFSGYGDEPARMAAAARSLPNTIIRDLLEATQSCWDGKNFFDTGHPFNVFKTSYGTFDNVFTGATISSGQLKTIKKNFRTIKSAQKDIPLGQQLTDLLVPAAQEQDWRDLLETDILIQAVDASKSVQGQATSGTTPSSGNAFGAAQNRHRGTVNLVVCDELTSDTVFYALSRNKAGMYPWILLGEGAPENILHDKQSELYKSKLEVGMSSIMRVNGGLAMPHCLHKYTLA